VLVCETGWFEEIHRFVTSGVGRSSCLGRDEFIFIITVCLNSHAHLRTSTRGAWTIPCCDMRLKFGCGVVTSALETSSEVSIRICLVLNRRMVENFASGLKSFDV
jgi:hypothetical protein